MGANREENYSRGIRQAIAKLYSKMPNWKIGQHTGEYTEVRAEQRGIQYRIGRAKPSIPNEKERGGR